ncbi:MAG TPA: peptidoglycan recognition family protein [Phycisphaerae bacterium]|nr:peptidoglycan recognition family protein [Phycisphaerae bacterium]
MLRSCVTPGRLGRVLGLLATSAAVLTAALIAGCSQAHVPAVEITPRAEWADAAPIQDRLVEQTPERLTVHHAGVMDTGDKPGDVKMRGLLHYSLEQKPWGDVPYHFVIDRNGHIWEGRALRYAPDTNTGYDVTGHVGICVNGDLTRQPLRECQYRALVDLLVKLSAELNIPDDRIAGHMDYSPGKTDCPGVLEQYIRDDTLRNDVKAVRAGRSYAFADKAYDRAALSKVANKSGK